MPKIQVDVSSTPSPQHAVFIHGGNNQVEFLNTTNRSLYITFDQNTPHDLLPNFVVPLKGSITFNVSETVILQYGYYVSGGGGNPKNGSIDIV